VQPPGDTGWTVPPFECTSRDRFIYGRGVADDKGPLVQALLAMATLTSDARPRTHTLRLLVGTDEESANEDIATYLKTHAAPDVTLVLDSEFPVVVGEKAWDALELTVTDPFRTKAGATGDWVLSRPLRVCGGDTLIREGFRLRSARCARRSFPRDTAARPAERLNRCGSP
jgi:acetylornithine deacetylase/succinyl-diaminopimelate desuccinylase-like protein